MTLGASTGALARSSPKSVLAEMSIRFSRSRGHDLLVGLAAEAELVGVRAVWPAARSIPAIEGGRHSSIRNLTR